PRLVLEPVVSGLSSARNATERRRGHSLAKCVPRSCARGLSSVRKASEWARCCPRLGDVPSQHVLASHVTHDRKDQWNLQAFLVGYSSLTLPCCVPDRTFFGCLCLSFEARFLFSSPAP